MSEYAEFTDENFRLLVLEKLMYFHKVIQPEFNVFEFAANHLGRTIDIEEEGYDPIHEVQDYFRRIEIKKEWLTDITELRQEGSYPIWTQIIPFWCGTTDDFDICSTADTNLLPNLKKLILFYNEENPEILEEFKAKGIDAKWV
ncbi:DUF6892 domain-containing protein [Microbulbifer variabilis]|uniref:DUF6892 domain-containing protein n=1 Tax=Microbulbifer variabilis TaxID=266805 RepID=UPI0003794DCF|nr:hypothetical protein [Microbulbifer variabilis]